MKPSLLSIAALLVIGLSMPSDAGYWKSITAKDVRVLKTDTGKRMCVIGPVSSAEQQIGFEIATSADEKMVDLALKAVEEKTTCWFYYVKQMPQFKVYGDVNYYATIVEASSFVFAKP